MSDEIKVIELIESDNISMRKACQIVGIKHSTFLSKVEILGLTDQYARACEARQEFLFDEIIDIADDGSNDTYVTEDGEGTNYDVIQRSKLRIDARKWALSKMNPRKYGDKMDLTSDNQPLPTPMIIMPKPTSE